MKHDAFDLKAIAQEHDLRNRIIAPDPEFLAGGIALSDPSNEPARNYAGSRGEEVANRCRMGCGDIVTISDRYGICRECMLSGTGHS